MTFVMADVQMQTVSLEGRFCRFSRALRPPRRVYVWGLLALHGDLKPGKCMTSLCPECSGWRLLPVTSAGPVSHALLPFCCELNVSLTLQLTYKSESHSVVSASLQPHGL